MKFSSLFYAAAVVLAVQGFNVSTASAQSQDSVVAGCTGGGSCAVLVTAYVNSMRAAGMSTAQINNALANLTAALANAAQTNQAARGQLASGIRAAAAATTDARSTQMLTIAQTLDAGDDLPATAASGA